MSERPLEQIVFGHDQGIQYLFDWKKILDELILLKNERDTALDSSTLIDVLASKVSVILSENINAANLYTIDNLKSAVTANQPCPKSQVEAIAAAQGATNALACTELNVGTLLDGQIIGRIGAILGGIDVWRNQAKNIENSTILSTKQINIFNCALSNVNGILPLHSSDNDVVILNAKGPYSATLARNTMVINGVDDDAEFAAGEEYRLRYILADNNWEQF